MYVNARKTVESLHVAARGGFVTGVDGMGDVAITTKMPHRMRGYYSTVFDARLSDYIDETINGLKLKIRFLRVNERHHTVAIASVNRLPLNPIRTRIQHCNVQVADLDDLTLSYQRVKELGFDMALSVGQQTNDKVVGSQVVSSSHQGISIWGHTAEGQTVVDILERFRTGPHSALHRERTVPALAGAGIPDD